MTVRKTGSSTCPQASTVPSASRGARPLALAVLPLTLVAAPLSTGQSAAAGRGPTRALAATQSGEQADVQYTVVVDSLAEGNAVVAVRARYEVRSAARAENGTLDVGWFRGREIAANALAARNDSADSLGGSDLRVSHLESGTPPHGNIIVSDTVVWHGFMGPDARPRISFDRAGDSKPTGPSTGVGLFAVGLWVSALLAVLLVAVAILVGGYLVASR